MWGKTGLFRINFLVVDVFVDVRSTPDFKLQPKQTSVFLLCCCQSSVDVWSGHLFNPCVGVMS